MMDNLIEFFNNFDFEDLIGFFFELDLLKLLSNPVVVSLCIMLGILSIYRKWRLIIITVLSYTFLYGYLFITFVIIRNTEVQSPSTFLLLISAILLITGLAVYKHLIRPD